MSISIGSGLTHDVHAYLGIFLCIGTVIQTIGGITSRIFICKIKWKLRLITLIKFGHRALGYSLILVAHINMYFGLKYKGSILKNYIVIQYGVYLLCLLLIEIRYRNNLVFKRYGRDTIQ